MTSDSLGFPFFASRLFRWLDRVAQGIQGSRAGWRQDVRSGLFAVLVSLFLAAPVLWIYLEPGYGGRLADFMAQAAEPLRRDLKEPILGYRITVPLLNHWLGFRGFAVIIPAITVSFVNLVLCSRILRQRTQSSLFSIFGGVGLSLTFFIAEGTTFWSAPDSVAHLLALLPAAFSLHWAYFVGAVPIAMFVDERSIVSFVFLLIFLWRRDFGLSFKAPAFKIICFLAGLSLWKLGRVVLDSGWLAEPPVNSLLSGQASRVLEIGAPHDGWGVWIVNIICAFKWMYVFPVILSALLIRWFVMQRNPLTPMLYSLVVPWSLYLLLFFAWVGSAAFNGDVWRTVSFAFFFVLEAMLLLWSARPLLAMALARISMLLMIATPIAYVGSALTPQLQFPLPLVLWRTYAGGGAGFMYWLRSFL